MTELLDQDVKLRNNKRLYNSMLLGLIVILEIVISFRVYIDVHSINPFLPNYSMYFIHGQLINFAFLLIPGLLLALISRILKKYLLSTVVLLLSLGLAYLLKDAFRFYEVLY